MYSIKLRFATAACLGSFLIGVSAAEPLSLDEAIREAYANNRNLEIATLEIERAKSRLRWSGRLENPELEINATSDEPGNDENEGSFEVGFTQAFPITSRLKRERHLRHHQVILAEAEIAERRRELAGEVDLALTELAATRRRTEVAASLVELNREISAFLDEQTKQGVVSSLDAMQAKLAGRQLEQQVGALRAEEEQNRIALNRLLGADPETPQRVETLPPAPADRPSIEVSLSTVLQRRPDYVLNLAKIGEAEAAVALEESKRWQDVSLRWFVEQEDSVDEPEGFDGNTFAGFGVSIPLPLRDRNQEGIEQAQIDLKEAGKRVDAARFDIRSECEEAFRKRSDTWKLAREATGELLSLARENLEAFRKAYEQGQASLIQVQRAQEQLLELQTGSLEFLADYHRATARVRFVTGAYPGLSVESEKNPQTPLR